MHARFIVLSALSLTLAACQTPDGGSSPVTTAGAGTSVGASGQASTPLGAAKSWEAPARAEVWELAVTTQPKAGGPTLADVDADKDPDDAVAPEVPVTLSSGAFTATGTIKARGQSTRQADQMSYAIKLPKDAPTWHGYRSILLNKHPYDLTRVRNKLSFDFFAYLPELASPGTHFVHLTADGKDLGLFTQIEKVDKAFLAAHGLDDKGNLYKAENFGFNAEEALKASDAPGYDEKAFEKVLSIEGSKDHKALVAMVEAVNDDDQPIDTVIARHFDRRNFVTWLAMNVLTDNQDTVSRNYLLYRASGNSTWYFLPWDYDAAWGFYDQPDEKTTQFALQRWQLGLPNWWDMKLVRRFLQVPANAAELDARVHELASGLMSRAHVQALLDSYQDVVAPAVAKAPDVNFLPDRGADKVAAWRGEFARLASVLEGNLARYEETRQRPMPIWLDDAEVGAGGHVFRWDASYSLAGHGLTYDLEVSRTPAFASGDVVVAKKGLTGTEQTVSEPLSAGTYYYRVTVRDVTAPTTLWQWPFDNVSVGGKTYDGMKAFTVQ